MEREEQWKEIELYDGKYHISNNGDVLNMNNSTLVATCMDATNRYLTVSLYQLGKLKTFRIHRLVGLYFVPNPDNLSDVNHIDGDKLNNNDWNLEWTNPRENACHKSKNSKTSSQYIGVSWSKQRLKWNASITINSKKKHLGVSTTELGAYQLRCDYEKNNNIINKYL